MYHCLFMNLTVTSWHLKYLFKVLSNTHQFEDFEEVQISIEDVLYLLQPLLAEGTHGVADSVEPHATGEDDEALQQGLAAGYVFQLQVWDTKGKLGSMETKGIGGMLGLLYVSKIHQISLQWPLNILNHRKIYKNMQVQQFWHWQRWLNVIPPNCTCSSRILALTSW